MTDAGITPKRILIAGCGKIGQRLGDGLAPDHEVWGIRRSLCESKAIQYIRADITQPESLAGKLPSQLDYLVYCLTPSTMSEDGYRDAYITGLANVLAELGDTSGLKRLYFVSSTSVYHQDDSSTVDENSPTLPTRFSGQILLEAEQQALNSSVPATVIRFSGIYAGNRSRLIDQIKENKTGLTSDSRLTNRIHEDDCVGFLDHLLRADMNGQALDQCYLASDSAPAEYNDVIRYIASITGTSLTLNPKSESRRRAGNKRCSNQRMLGTGYELKYPSFKEGYRAMLDKQA